MKARNVFNVLKHSSSKTTNGYLTLLLIFTISNLYVGNIIGVLPSAVYGAIGDLSKSEFWDSIGRYFLFSIIISVILMMFTWVSDRLAISLRETLLTGIQKDYISKITSYEFLLKDSGVDNPDARITEDVTNWANSFSKAVSQLSQMPIVIIYYSYTTTKEMTYWTVVVCFAFAFLSVLISQITMRPIVKLTYNYEAAQGDFRLRHIGIKENAETVALSHGQKTEQELLALKFQSVLRVQKKLANQSVFMNTVTNTFQFFGNGIVYICFYFFHPDSMDPTTLGQFISRVSFEVIMLIYGLTSIMDTIKTVSQLFGYSKRITELLEVLQACADIKSKVERSDSIEFQSVSIAPPNSDLILSNLTFKIDRGQTLFITGPSGIGKSSIFRVVAGLWNPIEGVVKAPPLNANSLMILTSTPYIPMIGKNDCLTFPSASDSFQQSEIDFVLDFLKLELKGDGDEWYKGLSPGEKQRIAMARVLLNKPRFVLMDEATNAIPSDLEKKVFEKLKELGISFITISHNTELQTFHEFSLIFEDNGEYSYFENL